MASLAIVPVEILVLVFTYLQCFAELTSIAGVRKDWRNAVYVPTSIFPYGAYLFLPMLLPVVSSSMHQPSRRYTARAPVTAPDWGAAPSTMQAIERL
jgi:hypothetical protein